MRSINRPVPRRPSGKRSRIEFGEFISLLEGLNVHVDCLQMLGYCDQEWLTVPTRRTQFEPSGDKPLRHGGDIHSVFLSSACRGTGTTSG